MLIGESQIVARYMLVKCFFDNIIFSLQKAGGISTVWANLIKHITPLSGEFKFLEYKDQSNIFRKNIEIPASQIEIIHRFNPVFSQFIHPKVDSNTPFIFHSSYFRTCSNPNAINVTTVHDFIYEQGNPNIKQKIRIGLNYQAIRKSDAIVCVSENTRKDLLKYLPDIDNNKIFTIYNGVSENYQKLKANPYPQYNNHILFVGGRQGYKNFDFIVESLRGTEFKLLICGKGLSKDEKLLLEKLLPNKYDIIIFPSNDELNKIYNSVYALAYPSSYEGFGIPVLEAQRAGCPVIALNSSSIPEIIGETSLLMEKLSKDTFLSKLESLRSDSIREQIICMGLNNSKNFSWEKMAQEYFKLYNDILSKRL